MSIGRRTFLKGVGITLGAAVAGTKTVLAGPGADVQKRRELLGPMGDTIDEFLGGERPEVVLPTLTDSPNPSSLDPLDPAHWAKLYAQTLQDQMVLGNVIHRDWTDQLCTYGDSVNSRRFTGIDTHVRCMLDGHFYSSFIIRDSESGFSLPVLYDFFIRPAAISHARALDSYIHEELSKAGQQISVSNPASAPLMVRGMLNKAGAPLEGRVCLLPPEWDTAVLKEWALDPEGVLGGYYKLYGQDCYMSQSVPSPIGLTETSAALVARPLPHPINFGVRAGRNDDYKLGVRCTMMYDVDTAGTRVTFDSLVGVAVLEPDHIIHVGRNA